MSKEIKTEDGEFDFTKSNSQKEQKIKENIKSISRKQIKFQNIILILVLLLKKNL